MCMMNRAAGAATYTYSPLATSICTVAGFWSSQILCTHFEHTAGQNFIKRNSVNSMVELLWGGKAVSGIPGQTQTTEAGTWWICRSGVMSDSHN